MDETVVMDPKSSSRDASKGKERYDMVFILVAKTRMAVIARGE